MADKIDTIEGIGPSYAEKLKEAGIETVDAFLEKAAKPTGRQDLAETTGISEKLILTWVNHADLFRIKGIGPQLADLLEEAGVNTVPQLAQRNAANLAAKLVEINEEKKLTKAAIHEKTVAKWVEQAKEMPRVVEY